MWFSSKHKTQRTPPARSARHTFRPRLELLEDRCLLSAGALDTTFGSGGMVTGPISVQSSGRRTQDAVAVQPADGKIVAGGYTTSGNRTKFALARYNSNGSLDTTFGPNHNGVVSTAVGSQSSAINGLALQSNGDIVAAGSADYNRTVAFALARYTPSGALDSTFGTSGTVVTPVSGAVGNIGARAMAVAIYSNTGTSSDKIYVAGQAGGIVNEDFVLIRYNMNGSLDTTFGNGGIVITPNFGSGLDEVYALAIQPADGRIVVAGGVFAQGKMAVARYMPDGTLDPTFNPGGTLSPGVAGIVTVAPPGMTAYGYGVVVQNSGAIVVSGFSQASTNELILARLTSTGQVDTTFGGSNTGFAVNPNMSIGWSTVQDPNGDLLIAGTSSTSNLAVAAYLPGGTPDTTFGAGGITTANFSGGAQGRAIAIDPSDGKIVALGFTGSNASAALARFLPPDTKIGSFTGSQTMTGGPVTLTAANILDSNPASTITRVAFYYLDSNNNAVLLGYGTLNTSKGAWSLATSSLVPGTTYNLLALATDTNGASSDPFTISFTVM